MTPPCPSRREFLRQATLFASCIPALWASDATNKLGELPPIVGFSKPFQQLSPEAVAELVEEVGWDGIECSVRPQGHIEPERVAEDLPRLAAALRGRGKHVHILATTITSLDEPNVEKVLRTAADLGVQTIRLGYWRYRDNDQPPVRVQELRPALRDLEAACRTLGLRAGYQNHSGRDLVGGPVWDILPLIQEINSPHLGMCFDLGHATVEGGLSWPIDARAVEPYLVALFVKDFVWQETPRGWRPAWCPLGGGMIPRSYLRGLMAKGVRVPINQHHEYELGDRATMVKHLQRDLKVLRQWLA